MSNYDSPEKVTGLTWEHEQIVFRAEDVNGEDLVEMFVRDAEGDKATFFLNSEARHSLISILARKSAITARVKRELS